MNEKRPNILFVLTDDHAAPAISCYGDQLHLNNTPNIDRVAWIAFCVFVSQERSLSSHNGFRNHVF